jgi:hypothetical protein
MKRAATLPVSRAAAFAKYCTTCRDVRATPGLTNFGHARLYAAAPGASPNPASGDAAETRPANTAVPIMM